MRTSESRQATAALAAAARASIFRASARRACLLLAKQEKTLKSQNKTLPAQNGEGIRAQRAPETNLFNALKTG